MQNKSFSEAETSKIKGFVCSCGIYFEYPVQILWDGGLFYPYKCSCGCEYLLYMRVAHLTKYAPDVASATSAEPDSGLESVPAVESDTQPRG